MNTQEFANSIRQKYPDAVSSDGRKYSEIPDSELVSKIVEKYPVYKSQITDLNQTLEKQTEKSKEPSTLQNFSTGFAASYLKPLQNIGNAVLNPIKKAIGLENVKTGVNEQAFVPQSTAEKVGNVAGEVSQFFIPAGAINKAREAVQLYKGAELANALSKIGITNPKTVNTIVNGGKLALESLIEGGSSAAITAAQTGELGTEAKTSGLIGASVPVIGKGFNLLKKAEAPILSFTSGVPQKAIEEAQKGGSAINSGLKTNVEDIQKQASLLLNEPKTGLYAQLSNEFGQGLDSISAKYKQGLAKSAQDAATSFKNNTVAQLRSRGAMEAADKLEQGFNPNAITAISQIPTVAKEALGNLQNFPLVKEAVNNWQKTSKLVYDFSRGSEDFVTAQNSLKDALVSNLRKYKVGVIKGEPNFSRSAIVSQAEQNNIKSVIDTVKTWKDFSPEGMQSLMSRLGALSKFETTKGNQASAVLGAIYNDAKGKLVSKFYPELAQLRTKFDTTKGVLDTIDSVVGGSAKTPQQIQSAVTRLSNLYKTDKGTYLDAIRELSNRSGVDILGLLAGTEFQKVLPDFVRGIGGAGALGVSAALLNPYALLLAPLFSPRGIKNIVAPSQALKTGAKKTIEVSKKLLEATPSLMSQ